MVHVNISDSQQYLTFPSCGLVWKSGIIGNVALFNRDLTLPYDTFSVIYKNNIFVLRINIDHLNYH